jgi:hypothetical protein
MRTAKLFDRPRADDEEERIEEGRRGEELQRWKHSREDSL